MTLLLTLPLPHRYLRPNSAPPNWRIKFGLTKQARERAKRETFKLIKDIDCPAWVLTGYYLKAYFRTKRHWDDDSVSSSAKAVRDGIADAIGQDDRNFKCLGVETFTDTKNPRLEVHLEVEELV